ncbi:MAG: preprotein translocase subunit SecG [Deltaproteobacteria bacterium]|nr:preprotein translocase subunit SecG [Deltaproteobacteria bacterium]
MYVFFLILHILVSLFLIMVVLLQSGSKGAGMGAAFGGSGQTMFGARGQTTPMHKLTAVMAILFMSLSVILATLSSQNVSDLAEEPLPPGHEEGLAPEPGTDMAGGATGAASTETAGGEDAPDSD